MKKLQIHSDTLTGAEKAMIQAAFDERNWESWELPVSKYGYQCTNLDEVKTHIRYRCIAKANPTFNFSVN